jgi:hypothetical protein
MSKARSRHEDRLDPASVIFLALPDGAGFPQAKIAHPPSVRILSLADTPEAGNRRPGGRGEILVPTATAEALQTVQPAGGIV